MSLLAVCTPYQPELSGSKLWIIFPGLLLFKSPAPAFWSCQQCTAPALPLIEALVSQEGTSWLVPPFEPQKGSLHPFPHLRSTRLYPTLDSATQQLAATIQPSSICSSLLYPSLCHWDVPSLDADVQGSCTAARRESSSPLCLLQPWLLGLRLPKTKEWISQRRDVDIPPCAVPLTRPLSM